MLRTHSPLLVLILLLVAVGVACERASPPPPPASEQTSGPAAEPTESAAPQELATPTIAAGAPTAVGQTVQRIAARHILVAHESAARRPVHVHRSAAAARQKAEDLAEQLARGEDFAALAKAQSDCPSAARGGFLGGFDQGTMDPSFEATAFTLALGEISGVIETPFGFHLILREPLEEIRIAQVLVGFSGSTGDASGRDRQQALELAQRARARLDSGEDFAVVAAELSDGAAGIRGGDLGWFTRGQFLPSWEERAFALQSGDTEGPFETTAGFHIIRRLD